MPEETKVDPTKTAHMYCVKCRQMVVVSDPKKETLKSGRQALRGKCPHCNTTTFKITGKD